MVHRLRTRAKRFVKRHSFKKYAVRLFKVSACLDHYLINQDYATQHKNFCMYLGIFKLCLAKFGALISNLKPNFFLSPVVSETPKISILCIFV